MKQRSRRLMALMIAATMTAGSVAVVPVAAEDDPYKQAEAAADDPYKQAEEAADDPYKQAEAAADDPYKQAEAAADDPYKQAEAATDDPYKQAEAAADDPYKQAEAATDDPYKQAEAASDEEEALDGIVPSADAKYTISVTEDGWIKVENEGGDTLGLAADSAVKLLEVDGYAFKDMNQNGELDKYEDWRLSTEERAADLAGQMQGEEIAAVLTHGGWGDFTTEPLTEDDGSYTYLMQGGRGGVTRSISQGGAAHAKWANAIQAVAEQSFYGIPAMLSIDPSNISGMVETLSLASTMDTELAAEIGQETAKEYRAAGVTALLGPQVDIASPIMSRAGGTYGEDPQLTLDIATAYVNGMQSTYDENGEDLGWGNESVYCFTKHFAGAGATEGGRDDHGNGGRYAVFPGNNLEAHLITYFDGVFNLPGKTDSSGIMTEYAIDVDADGAFGAKLKMEAKQLAPYDVYIERHGLTWPVREVNGEWLETKWRFCDGHQEDGFDEVGVERFGKHDLAGGVSFYKSTNMKPSVVFRPWEPPAEAPDDRYPFVFCTGRLLEHWHTGSMTRRVPQLHNALPEAVLDMNRADCERLGIADGDKVRVKSRFGQVDIRVSTHGRTKPPAGTVFAAFFAEETLVNLAVQDTYCPLSKEPDFKKTCVSIEKLEG